MYFGWFIFFVVVNSLACFGLLIHGCVVREDNAKWGTKYFHGERKINPAWRKGLVQQKLAVVLLPVGILVALLWPVEAVLGLCLGLWHTGKFLGGLVNDLRELRSEDS